jgi:hypothetical protein
MIDFFIQRSIQSTAVHVHHIRTFTPWLLTHNQCVLWVLACDYYLKEELQKDIEEKEEYKDLYEKCKNEFKTREYNSLNVVIAIYRLGADLPGKGFTEMSSVALRNK